MCLGIPKNFRIFVFASLAVLLIALPGWSRSTSNSRASRNIQVLGAEDQSKQIAVTFWLKQHDKAEFDEMVRQMYDRNSPSYHHWLTLKEYQTRFAPSAGDMAIVRQHLTANNLQVVATDKLNHAVTARGMVADVQRATGVQLNRVLISGEAHRLPSEQPAIPGAAGKLVYAVQGLTDISYRNHVARPVDPDTGKHVSMVPLSKLGKAQQYFTTNCLRVTETHQFKTTRSGPYAIYSGTRYGGNIYAGPPNLPPCGYDAPQVEKAYGLTSLYKQKLDGTGKTVVIVDAYGDDYIQSDANTFAQVNGLPQLTSNNFAIYYPTGPTRCRTHCLNGSWDVETAIDVEWSHSIAPGADIALVLARDNSFSSLDLSVLYAIDNLLGPVISNSWGAPEAAEEKYDPSELTVQNNINETGAALGISVNFSSGDSGDSLLDYGEITVAMPAASPYATSVGGTSLFLNPDHTINLQTGWGTNITEIANVSPNPPLIPPNFIGFYGGSGGGKSAVWRKPSYQRSLSGRWRLVPDIAFLADPYTGVEFILTEGQQGLGLIGGTSVSCPMFSGMWAISTQAASSWLGQAAPLLYGLPADAITDVLAVNGPNNVSGTNYTPPAPPVYYSPEALLAPVQSSTNFVGTLYHSPFSTRWFALSFGTDSSLTTGPGWDNVTGLGTPNGANFVTAVVGAK